MKFGPSYPPSLPPPASPAPPTYLPYLPTYLLTSYMYLPTASQQKAEILDWRTTLVDRLLRGLEMEAIARYEEFLRIA